MFKISLEGILVKGIKMLKIMGLHNHTKKPFYKQLLKFTTIKELDVLKST